MANTFPTVVINNVTYTAKRWGQFPTISYTNGATAGSEVVSVDSSLNITVQIQDGVSTNAQIKTALDATAGSATGLAAGDLVSVAIAGGHTTDVNKTVNQAFLTGGVAAAKATATIGALKYTAASAGTGGNSITVQYVDVVNFTVASVTDATHLVVDSTAGLFAGQTIKQGANITTITTVTDATHLVVGDTTGWSAAAASSPAIAVGSEIAGIGSTANTVVVQMVDGSSTALQIAAAIVANSGTNALVAAASTGANPTQAKAWASSPVSLAGGVAAAAASKILQDLTFTAAATGVGGNAISITYTTGATAGAEVVTVSSNAITIQIQNATSTATQIKAAFDAVGAATALASCTISGTGANTQSTVNAAAMSGAVAGTQPNDNDPPLRVSVIA